MQMRRKLIQQPPMGMGGTVFSEAFFFLFLNSYLMFVHCQDVANPPCYYLLLYIYRDVKEK